MTVSLSGEEIAKQIQELPRRGKNRAALIARDQTNKLNGQLTMLRQKSIGIEEYIWRTAGDTRVRVAHRSYADNTFKWKNPPEGGHPGQDINCRCYPEPVIPQQWLEAA